MLPDGLGTSEAKAPYQTHSRLSIMAVISDTSPISTSIHPMNTLIQTSGRSRYNLYEGSDEHHHRKG